MNSSVYALAASDSGFFAGGAFTTAGGKVSTYVAKWASLAFRSETITISNGTFHALLTGPDPNSVIVDGTSTFANWTPLITNTLRPSGTWQFSVPVSTNSHQFYRVRLRP